MLMMKKSKISDIGLDHMKEVRKNAQDKWDSTGFLDGLSGHVHENVAQLFEGAVSQRVPGEIERQSWVNTKTTTLSKWQLWRKYKLLKLKKWFNKYILRKKEPEFSGILLPIVKRIAVQTMAFDLVPVMPSGQLSLHLKVKWCRSDKGC